MVPLQACKPGITRGALMGHWITLEAADGHGFDVWEEGQPGLRPTLVVLQEIFGVNHHIRAVCEDFAQAGFHVLAPALFDRAERGISLGYTAADVEQGKALRARIPLEQTLADLRAVLAHPRSGRAGLIGYCWGGTLAWESACRLEGLAAACCWYGAGIASALEQEPACPVQMHFGGQDASIPPADIAAIRQRHSELEMFVYDEAGHGFGCAERAAFNAPAYALARERSLSFLENALAP